MMDTRQLTGLLYSMGHTFDNLASTYMATAEFLSTNNPEIIGSRSDLALLQDLRDAASYTLHEPLATPLDVDFVRGINAELSRTAAIEPGKLRESANIMVHTASGAYIPPVPDATAMGDVIGAAMEGDDPMRDAARLFAHLAKMQPFGDGNKRTALLAANRLLMLRGVDRAMVVPTEDPAKGTFNTMLGEWYVHDAPAVIDWLAGYNREISGVDDLGHAVPVRQ
ncbi:MAG: Fic family protein [Bifidobacterium sp.]|nr:Fic family protein [Bifidobacterium sp.]